MIAGIRILLLAVVSARWAQRWRRACKLTNAPQVFGSLWIRFVAMADDTRITDSQCFLSGVRDAVRSAPLSTASRWRVRFFFTTPRSAAAHRWTGLHGRVPRLHPHAHKQGRGPHCVVAGPAVPHGEAWGRDFFGEEGGAGPGACSPAPPCRSAAFLCSTPSRPWTTSSTSSASSRESAPARRFVRAAIPLQGRRTGLPVFFPLSRRPCRWADASRWVRHARSAHGSPRCSLSRPCPQVNLDWAILCAFIIVSVIELGLKFERRHIAEPSSQMLIPTNYAENDNDSETNDQGDRNDGDFM